MDQNTKLYLLFKDRVGIVADISTLVAGKHFNILSLEVERADDRARVYLEIEKRIPAEGRGEIFELLGKIPDLIEISFIDTLPREERENRFRVVLDNIRDGVTSIDGDGKITTINKIARRVLNYKADEVIGKHITELQLPDYDILECLEGKEFSNIKKDIVNEKGRFQYFATGRPITDLANRIVGAVEIGKDMQEIKMLAQSMSQSSPVTFSDFIGKSPAIRDAILFAQKIAKTDSIVSIRGESGTGKEVFARSIHAASDRKGPFIAINCAALPETLLESELFGYVGGSFTGARKDGKPGLFELACGGTIFLDEIGEMPFSVQAKILRVIEENRLRPLGGSKEIRIDSRIITASNENLEQMVEQKLFREDLYYRINVLPINIPPLRERRDDIPLLVEHFLFLLDSKLDKGLQFLTPGALDKLYNHRWPGNVRELKNVIERAAIICDWEKIDSECILFSFEIGKGSGDLKSHILHIPEGQSLQDLLDLYEKQIIGQALAKSDSIRKTAKSLGVSHTALLNKLKKHKIVMEAKQTIRR
jgi:PAS domain S-box-containing protein/TyrR family helix-turn-helix protein